MKTHKHRILKNKTRKFFYKIRMSITFKAKTHTLPIKNI